MNIGTDLKRAVREVPPWGWGIIGIGALYLVVHKSKASAASPATQGPVVPDAQPFGVTDPSGGMSAYIEGLNSGYNVQAETLSSALQDLQQSNADLLDSVRNQQAGGLAGGSVTPFDPPAVPDPSTFQNTIHPIQYDPSTSGFTGFVPPGTVQASAPGVYDPVQVLGALQPTTPAQTPGPLIGDTGGPGFGLPPGPPDSPAPYTAPAEHPAQTVIAPYDPNPRGILDLSSMLDTEGKGLLPTDLPPGAGRMSGLAPAYGFGGIGSGGLGPPPRETVSR